METLQNKLDKILSSSLRDGRTDLETLPNGHVCGHVISSEFADKTYDERRNRIWQILERGSLNDEEKLSISTLLTYSPEEWAYQPEDN